MTKSLLTAFFSTVLLFVQGFVFGQDQKAIDDQVLKNYFAKNKIVATKAPSGLYYTINKPGNGEKPKFGKHVTMHYLGKLLDGTRFDGNVDEQYNLVQGREPFIFALGVGQVIKGWDEGVKLLEKGSRATLYLPSWLAYGQNGVPGLIPPNSVLVFNVEVVDFEK
ncbi:MAG: Peptidyl-prolyl cis-trans isomerase cyclophilin type [Flavipsychrobacter sp.]|jgi:FKBP-type peptidyl-prolyl cis-trans isomerase|nr:Peptidyl-prolyl cis-trans isomerase cyclophilin type [Flavipsychrobacter sp.]